MTAHPRIRKTIKWGGLALCLVLIGAWLASGFYVVVYAVRGGTMVELHAGRIRLTAPAPGPAIEIFPPGWHATRNRSGFWPPIYDCHDVPLIGRTRSVALWSLALVSLAATGAAWILDIRSARGPVRCPHCQYDRVGLRDDAPCPECGGIGRRTRRDEAPISTRDRLTG